MKATIDGFERIIEFVPAFDRRDKNPAKNYGIHGVELRFILKNESGAVQFVLYSGMHAKSVRDEHRHDLGWAGNMSMAADLGYHAPTPQYESHTSKADCPYLDGRPCFYDGSGLDAEKPFTVFTDEGEDALWAYLAEYHKEIFPQ